MLGASTRVAKWGVSFQLFEIVKPLLEYSFQGFSGLNRKTGFGHTTTRLPLPSVAKTTLPKSRGLTCQSAVGQMLLVYLIF